MLETMTVHAGRSPLTPERARELMLAPEARAALEGVVRLAASSLDSPVATLGVRDDDLLRLPAQQGVPHPWSAAGAVPLQCVPCGYTLFLPDPLVIDDLEKHPIGRELWLEAFPRRAYLGTAVRVSGEPVAVLAVSSPEPRRWSPQDVARLRDAAAVVRELEALDGPAPVRAIIEAALAPVPPPAAAPAGAAQAERPDHEANWRSLLEESGTGIFVTTRDGLLLEHNRATLRIFGCEDEDASSLDVRRLFVRRTEQVRLLRELERQGGIRERAVELRRRDGSTVQCLVSAVARRDAAGSVVGYRGVVRDITEQLAAERKLVEIAFRDSLTGLPNRSLLLDRMERLLRHSRRHEGYRFGLLFIDLDRFKAVNDTLGHQQGDRLLVAVARRLERCVRQEDTIARIGGDEFAILLDGIVDAAGVVQVTERILYELAQPYEEVAPAGIGASIGIALSMTGYESVDEVLRDADTAMYRAKSAGRNGFAVFDMDMYSRMRAQLQLEAELREAVQRDQLALQYHPVVALEGGTVMGMEALLRWTHPARGVLLPDEFMPLAERTGLIVEIGWWVLREACRQLRAWQLEYPHTALRLTMNVNFSARQFVQPDLIRRMDEVLEETGVDARCLRLDLKESVVMADPELAADLLAELGHRGIQICIDDFGTGYSSLQALRELPISGVKIAPRFVRELHAQEGGSRAVVQTIIALGQSMAIDAIAEGVETAEQLEELRSLGTRFAQGFLFSLPLDADRARELIAS